MHSILRNLYAMIVMHTPLARRQWAEHVQHYLPILAPAFHHDPYARLLTLRLLDSIREGKPSEAAMKDLKRLEGVVRQDVPGDYALYCFLQGMYAGIRDMPARMAWWLRNAQKNGARFHLIHTQLGLFHLRFHQHYDQALEQFDQAIDCIYQSPPLDERKRFVVALHQAMSAEALVMMHRTDEADAMLARAHPAQSDWTFLRAQALLRAVQGRSDEAHQALSALRQLDEEQWQSCADNVQLILEGTHPHFTAGEPDAQRIAEYWAWFVQAEPELLRLVSDNRRQDAYDLHHPHFAPLAPEDAAIDVMAVGFSQTDGKPRLMLQAKHSRNYDALITALIAACPPEIRSRWEILRKP